MSIEKPRGCIAWDSEKSKMHIGYLNLCPKFTLVTVFWKTQVRVIKDAREVHIRSLSPVAYVLFLWHGTNLIRLAVQVRLHTHSNIPFPLRTARFLQLLLYARFSTSSLYPAVIKIGRLQAMMRKSVMLTARLAWEQGLIEIRPINWFNRSVINRWKNTHSSGYKLRTQIVYERNRHFMAS
jgi:hypothetical protein